MNDCNDSEVMVCKLVEALRGTALDYFESLPQELRLEFVTLCNLFEGRFGRQEVPAIMRSKLKCIAQRVEEPLAEFAERTLKVASEGYSGMTGQWVQVLAVDAFLMGCSDKRSALSAMDKEPQTVDEAVKLMRRFNSHEKALGTEKKVRTLTSEDAASASLQVNRVEASTGSTNAIDVSQLNESIKMLTQLLAKQNTSPRPPGQNVRFNAQRTKNFVCFSCGEGGHIARNCPKSVPEEEKMAKPAKDKKKLVAAASDMLAAVKLDDDSETVKDNGMMMREVTLREESDRCTLVVNLTINTEDVEAVVDSGAQVSVLSKGFYDSLSDKPPIAEKIRLKGASASGVMIASRIDDVCVGLCGVRNKQSMYVADINDKCILGLDYLKTNKAVIDLDKGVLTLGDMRITGKYKYPYGNSVPLYRVRLTSKTHLWPNSVSRTLVKVETNGDGPVMVQARNGNERYLMPNTILTLGGSGSDYLMNDSDEHVHMTAGTEVGVAQDVLVEENITDNSSHRSLRSEDIDGKNQLRPCCSPQQEQLGDDGIAVCHDPRDDAKATRCLLRPENLDGWIGVETAVTVREVRKDDDFIRELQSQCNGWSNQKYRDALKSNLPIHMREMFEEAGDSLNRQQLLSLFQVLKSKVSVFSKGDTDLGNFTAVKHRISTGDAKPIKQRARHTPLGYANEEQQHLEKLLEADVIESSSLEWASPSVLVRKRDGSVRWCIDMRKLNDVTVKDRFPLPLIADCLDALAGCQYFTTLDMASGYCQLGVEEQDRDKTAFVTKYGLFSFKRMLFGLCNAPATFSRAISLVLKGLAWTSVIAFLDDIVVLGKDFDSHITNLTSVMDRLEQYGMKLKPKKCQLLKSSVIFLGKCVSSEGVQVPTHDIDRVVNWTRLACKRDVTVIHWCHELSSGSYSVICYNRETLI